MKTLLFLMTLALSLLTINGQTTTNFSSLASITPGTNDEIVIYTRPGTNAVARRASLQKVISSVGLATEAGALENGIFGGQRLTRVLFVGDSMSDAGWSYPSAALQTAWKLKTLYGDGGNALGNLQSGNNNSYYYPEAAIWPSVRMASVRAGESVIGQQDPNYVLLGGYPIAYAGDAKISGVYYAKWPKGGNLAITNSHMTSGLASVGTVVSTYSATTNIGYTAFNTTSNDNRLTLTGVSGSNVVLGVRFAPTNGPGVETFWYSLSGISMPDQLNPGTNALTDFRDLVLPDVLFYHAKDSDVSPLSTYYAKITTLIGSLATTNTKVFLVGTCPDLVVSDASLRAYNGVLEAVARSNNWGYIDLATAYPNIRRLQEIGYMEAGASAVHPLTNGAKAFADTIIRGLTTAQKSTASTAGAAVPDMLGVKQIAAASGKGADFDPAMILGADVNAFTTTSGAEKAGYIAGLQLNNTRFAINRYYVNGLGNISLTFGGEGSTTPGFSRGPDQTHFGTRNFLSWTINSEGNFVPGSGGAIGYESATNNSIGTAALPVPRSYTKTSEGRSGKGADFDPAMILGADVNAFTVTTNSEKAGYIAGLQYDNSRFAIARYYSSGAGNISLTFGGEGSTTPGFSRGPDATHFGTRNFLSWTIDQSGNFVPGAGGIPGYLSATNNTIGTAALPVPRIYASAITLNGADLIGGTNGGATLPQVTNVAFHVAGQSKTNWLNVLDYGADPSGASDSTAAFQAAINAASFRFGTSNSVQSTIKIPGGVYYVAGTLVFPLHSTYSFTNYGFVELLGEAPAPLYVGTVPNGPLPRTGTIILFSAANTNCVMMEARTNVPPYNYAMIEPRFRNIAFRQTDLVQNRTVFNLTNAVSARIEGCAFEGTNWQGAYNATYPSLSNIYVDGPSVSQGNTFIVRDCSFIGGGQGLRVSEHANVDFIDVGALRYGVAQKSSNLGSRAQRITSQGCNYPVFFEATGGLYVDMLVIEKNSSGWMTNIADIGGNAPAFGYGEINIHVSDNVNGQHNVIKNTQANVHAVNLRNGSQWFSDTQNTSAAARGPRVIYQPASTQGYTGGLSLFKHNENAAYPYLPAAVSVYQSMMSLRFGGWSGAAGDIAPAAIESVVDGAVASGSIPTAIRIMTGATDNPTAERIRWTSGGMTIMATNMPQTTSSVAGGIGVWNSNGANTYILKTSPGSFTWSSTNLWF